MDKKATYEELEKKISEYEDQLQESQRAISKYRERDRMLTTLMDATSETAVLTDTDGKIIVINATAAERVGKKPEELEGMDSMSFLEPHVGEARKRMLEKVVKTKSQVRFQEERMDRNYDNNLCPVFDDDGNVTAVASFTRDITERKLSEKALSQAIDIINKSPVVAFRWRTSEKMPIEFVSENVHKIFEYSSEEIMSGAIHYGDIIYTEDHARLKEEGLILNEQPGINEITHKPYRIVTKTGKIKWVEQITFTNLDDEGIVTHVQGIVIDITRRMEEQEAREKIEMQLSQAKRMEAIGTLAGGVAHDLNNILSGIVSYPELILLDLPVDSPFKKPIETIKKSGERATVIVQDLLALARRGVAISEVVNLNNIISDQLKSPEFNNLKLFHPGVTVEIDLVDDLSNIKGSPVHLSKTIMNLLSNSAEAMPDGGKININTENQYIDKPVNGYSEIIEGDYITVTVSDNGVGLSEEARERIFEPFYTKKTMGRSGTGLGMPLVWGTVKDHRGYITIKSIEGKGTSFKIYLPATTDEISTDALSQDIASLMGNGESILVVDDVDEQREIAERVLSKLGYSINTVSSGEDAVEYLREKTADIMLLDMIMEPGINGLETYKRIIDLRPGQKVVIVSGYSETTHVKELQRIGGGKYIKKPYSLMNIGLAIKEELQKQSS